LIFVFFFYIFTLSPPLPTEQASKKFPLKKSGILFRPILFLSIIFFRCDTCFHPFPVYYPPLGSGVPMIFSAPLSTFLFLFQKFFSLFPAVFSTGFPSGYAL